MNNTQTNLPRIYDLDWSGADPETAKLILRQGELFLDAQLRIAIAADQRAMVLAGFLAGFSATIFAAVVAYWTRSAGASGAVASFGALTAAILSMASLIAFTCAMPVKFGHAGSEPKQWWNWRKQTDTTLSIGGETENYQERIDVNKATLHRNAKRLWLAFGLAIAAPPLAGFICFSFRYLEGKLALPPLWW